jgi:hypothetical protein
MKHIVRKAYLDFEKEERFLNEMSANGLALTNYSWCKYVFEDAPKGEYIYRLQILEKPIDDPESQKYIQFMEETGTELAASYNRWVYFRRKAADGDFKIYSDLDSKLKHYKRIRLLFSIIAAANLLIGLYNWFVGNYEDSMGYLPINTFVSILSFAVVALLLIFLILPLTNKITVMEKEKDVQE